MEKLHYLIVSEEMVWLWYYDQLGGKHIKELLARDAMDFLKNLTGTQPVPEPAPDFPLTGLLALR
ncbi:hypothetical protein [Dyadobacter sp. Leaf189]|uniref:hypothetical protein n=1 Tax=Dyadobacter sp. Leaf189 TaxID=1736295 RepID=UPI0012F8E6A6|nr:hypothetical protein [Dyadobacter sp. Leaf189]